MTALERATESVAQDTDAVKSTCDAVNVDQKVLIERVGTMVEAYKSQRNALYSAAVALILMAGGIVLKGLGLIG